MTLPCACHLLVHFWLLPQSLTTLLLNQYVLPFQILLSRHMLYACIDLRDRQPTSLRNLSICWRSWQLYILNKKMFYFNLQLDKRTAITITLNLNS